MLTNGGKAYKVCSLMFVSGGWPTYSFIVTWVPKIFSTSLHNCSRTCRKYVTYGFISLSESSYIRISCSNRYRSLDHCPPVWNTIVFHDWYPS